MHVTEESHTLSFYVDELFCSLTNHQVAVTMQLPMTQLLADNETERMYRKAIYRWLLVSCFTKFIWRIREDVEENCQSGNTVVVRVWQLSDC